MDCFKGSPGDPVVACSGKLFVAVVDQDDKPFRQIKVQAKNSSGATCTKIAKRGGSGQPTVAYFGSIPTGTYSVTLVDDDYSASKAGVQVGPGHKTGRSSPNATLKVNTDLIVVTPVIEPEFQISLLDNDLAQHQASTETAIKPDLVYVYLSLKQSNDDTAFDKGATLKAEPENVEFFEDKELTTKVDSGTLISNDKLTADKPLQLFLKPKTKGKYKITLVPEDADDETTFSVRKDVEMEMAVVTLEMEVYHYDTTELANLEVDPDIAPPALSGNETYDPFAASPAVPKPEKYHPNLLKQYHDSLKDADLQI